MKKILSFILFGVMLLMTGCEEQINEDDIMWDVNKLFAETPEMWDVGVNYTPNIKGVFFQGEIYNEGETNIFAFLGIPTSPMPEGGYPAIVLVHGGLGKAFPDWVKMWTDKGYVAIAPDFDSHMATVSGGASSSVFNPLGGPRGYGVRTEDLTLDKTNSWTYQSISNIIKANNILRAMENVNKEKIGITGISWGSYLLGIAIGVDQRFSFAAGIYGAGYLDEDYGSSLYSMFAGMDDEMIGIYRKYYDPAAYLSKVKTPTLWMQGVNDYAFSPVQKQKAIDLIKDAPITYAYYEKMVHGQEQGSAPKEIFLFADSIVKNTDTMIKIKEKIFTNTSIELEIINDFEVARAEMFWTQDPEYLMHDATWYKEVVTIDGKVIKGNIPSDVTYIFIEITDQSGNKISSKFYEVL